jgi:hypothetical protein
VSLFEVLLWAPWARCCGCGVQARGCAVQCVVAAPLTSDKNERAVSCRRRGWAGSCRTAAEGCVAWWECGDVVVGVGVGAKEGALCRE